MADARVTITGGKSTIRRGCDLSVLAAFRRLLIRSITQAGERLVARLVTRGGGTGKASGRKATPPYAWPYAGGDVPMQSGSRCAAPLVHVHGTLNKSVWSSAVGNMLHTSQKKSIGALVLFRASLRVRPSFAVPHHLTLRPVVLRSKPQSISISSVAARAPPSAHTHIPRCSLMGSGHELYQ